MSPGNPIQNYLKCALEQYHFLFDREQFEQRDKLLAAPFHEVTVEGRDEYGPSSLAGVDRAARLDCPDWQILLKLKADGIGTLLPDVQKMRSLARALQVRFRGEVAAGRFDDAIRTAKTLFAMSRHMGEHPTLIGNLVGMAIANVGIEPLQEMLEQPGCPNLYWALTSLPDPLVSCEKGRAGERLIVSTVFNELNSTAPMTPAQLKKFIEPLDMVLAQGSPTKPAEGVRGLLDKRAKDPAKVQAARARLIESGIPESAVRSFPVDQVLLLDEKRECEVRFDDVTKITSIPTWQFEEFALKAKPYTEPAIFGDLLIQGQHNVRRVEARLAQRIALLRHVEALRLYAAEHDRAFPARLSEIALPLPFDPFTGKPFCYEASGKTAHLRGTPPRAEIKNPAFRLHYEITLRE
jgi:hypothetical protein